MGWLDRATSKRPSHRRVPWLLLALLAVDLIFIALHRLYLQGVLDVRFSIDYEYAWSEQYQHAKELVAALAAGVLLLIRGDLLYACWTGLFGYMFVDDALELHEHFGTWLSRLRAGTTFGMSEQSFGEMAVSLAVGGVFLLCLAWTWRRSTADARRLSIGLLAGLAALGTFGIAVDAIHSLIRVDPWRYRLGIIEEGGELLMVTVITWLVVSELVDAWSAVRGPVGRRRPWPNRRISS